MAEGIATGLLWFSALGCCVIAGLYFAFSTFILQAFDRLDPVSATQAMNAINFRILRSLFLPLFFGTTLSALALACMGIADDNSPGATAMLAGGALYAIGMFGVTVVCNVPLNNALARGPEGDAAFWPDYFRRWTLWNHIRTLASLLAGGLFVAAIAAR